MASGNAVIITSVLAGVFIFVALVTPGWFGLHMKSSDSDVKVYLSIFYGKICAQENGVDVCLTASMAAALEHSNSESDRSTSYMMEAIGALLCVIIGGIMTIIFGLSIRQQQTGPRIYSSGVAVTGLVFNIIGGLCAGILAIEFLIVNVNFSDASGMLTLLGKSTEIYFPYSLLIIGFGLVMGLVAVIVHIAAMRSGNRGESPGYILSPAVNGSTSVVVQHTNVSSIPYGRMPNDNCVM